MTRGLHNRRSCKRNGCPVIYEDRGPASGIPREFCSLDCHALAKREQASVNASKRTTPLVTRASSGTSKRRPVSQASPAQRAAKTPCLVTGSELVDQAHCWPRSLGGCDEPECVVSLSRPVHRALDDGVFDVLPYLIAHRKIAELQHALEHANGDLIALVERLTGCRVTLTPKTELLSVEDLERKWAA